MAKKETKEKVALERVYNVPLRKEWLKAPLYKRAEKAVRALRTFLAKHMKTDADKVRIGHYANLKIWEKGMRFPPHHIKVVAKKNEEGIVTAELEGAPVEERKEEVKKVEKEAAPARKEKSEGKSEVREAEIVKEEKKTITPKAKPVAERKQAAAKEEKNVVEKKEGAEKETANKKGY